MEIILVKQTDERLSESDAAVMRRFLFEYLDGCNDKDKRAWRRFVRALHESGSGEFFSIKTEHRRQAWYHRKHFKMMSTVFAVQERIEDFEQFRLWVKVGSGFCDWITGPKGGVIPIPKSIAYDRCDEGEMREFNDGCVKFFRTAHAQHYLWPALTPPTASEAMESILEPFESVRYANQA